MSYLGLVVLVSLACLLGVTIGQDIESLRKLIFGVDPKLGYLNPEKTLECLKKLRSLEPEDSQYISELIELSENKADKCDPQAIKAFFIQHQQDSQGIEAYKQHQWNDRKYECKEIWKKVLTTEASTLSTDERQHINELSRYLFQTVSQSNYKSSFLQTGTREFSSGILPYFISNSKYQIRKLLKSSKCRELYDREYTRLVVDLCANVLRKFKDTRNLFKIFIYKDQSNFVDDDKFTKHWLKNIEICKTVDSRKQSIHRELYKLFKEKYPQPGCLGTCAGGTYVVE